MFVNTKVLWLIEDVNTYLYYYVSDKVGQISIFNKITDDDYWTNNAYEAVGFDTELDAKKMIKYLKNKKGFENKNMIATDHMFL